MIQFIKNICRLLQLTALLFARGVAFYIVLCLVCARFYPLKLESALRECGRRIASMLQAAGPTFVKLGQAISTRPDLVGEIIADELSALQDRLHPFSFKHVRRQIEGDLGLPLEALFQEFSQAPVAAASIAQVHKAITTSGDVVAVKVLRPNIERRFSSDLRLLSMVISIIEWCLGESVHRLRLRDVLATLLELERFELDLRCEAAAADEIRQNTKDDLYIRIPKIYWLLTSRNVLTTEWIDGIPISDKEGLLSMGHTLSDIALRITTAFLNQAYRDGFFHADLHPGNLFVDQAGNIAMVDFGIIGILSKTDRIYIAEILYGFIERDYQRVADIHFEAGYVPRNKNRKLFALACRMIGEPIIGRPVHEISIAQLLKKLFEVTKQFDMPTQTQLLLLQKTMVTIEGIGLIIYPQINMWKLAEPWIQNWAASTFGIKAKLNGFKDESRNMIKRLPQLYYEGLEALESFNALNKQRLEEQEVKHRRKRKRYYRYYIASFCAGVVLAVYVNSLW